MFVSGSSTLPHTSLTMQRIDTENQTNGKLFHPKLKKNRKREGVNFNHQPTSINNVKNNKQGKEIIVYCESKKSRNNKPGGFKDNDKLEMFSRCFGSTHSRTKMAKKPITPRIKFKTKVPKRSLSYPTVSSFIIFLLARLMSILMYPVVKYLKLDRLCSISVLKMCELLEVRISPIYRRFKAILVRSFISSSNLLCDPSSISNLDGNILQSFKKSTLLIFGTLSSMWQLTVIQSPFLISNIMNTQQFTRKIGLMINKHFSQLLLSFNQRCIQTTQAETKSMKNCAKDSISTNQSPNQSFNNNNKNFLSVLKVSIFKFCAPYVVFLNSASSKCLNLATSVLKIASIGVSRKYFVARGFGVSHLSCIVLLLGLCGCVQAGPDTVNLTDDEENVLHIGGIFPIAGEGGWQGGQACMPAAYLALEDVNKRADLLPGFQLRLHSNDSEVSGFHSQS